MNVLVKNHRKVTITLEDEEIDKFSELLTCAGYHLEDTIKMLRKQGNTVSSQAAEGHQMSLEFRDNLQKQVLK